MNTTNLLTAGFSLLAVFSWGTSDFLGGLAARTSEVYLLTALTHASGLVAVTLAALLTHAPLPSHAAMGWGLASGICGGISLAIFYRALSSGRMGLNAPVAAVLGAAIPVGVAFSLEGMPHPVQIAGFVLAAVGIWFISKPDHLSGRPEGLWLAVIAGLGFAGFFICVHQAGEASALWVAAFSKCASVALVGAIAFGKALKNRPERRRLWLGLISGVLDVSGTVFFIRASQVGRLDVSVVLCSLYPAVTVLLARAFLKERFTMLRATGIAAAVLAMPMIALK